MKRFELVISDEAAADLQDIWDFIAEHSLQNADNFIDRIYERCNAFTRMPEMGRPRDELLPGLRSFPVKRYVIFYRIKEDTIEIVRVVSGQRDLESLF